MRSKTPFLVAFVLLSTLLLGSVVGNSSSHVNAQSTAQGYTLYSLQTFNQYGQFSLNETLHGANNSTALGSVTFGFPSSFQGHLASLSSYANLGSSAVQTTTSTSLSDNTLSITLTFAQNLGGTNSTAGIEFWVVGSLTPVNGSNYVATVLATPAVSIHLERLNSSVNFRDQTTYVSNSTTMTDAGFVSSTTFIETPTYNGQIQDWNYSTTNATSTLRAFPVRIYSVPASTGLFDFTYLGRQLSIDSSGQILVEDTLTVHNLGLNTVTTLPFSPLTNSTTLTAIPPPGPLLSNSGTVSVSGGQITLPEPIQPDSTISLIFQYPLGQSYWHFSNGAYDVSIPTTAPINAIIGKYHIYSQSSSGTNIVGSPLSLTSYNSSKIAGSVATMSFKVGTGSAFGYAVPIASLLFVAVLVAGIVFRPKTETVEKVGSTFDSLIKTIEDKASSTNEILSELKSRRAALNRNDLLVARTRLDDVRSKTNSRIGMLRSQLGLPTAAVQSGLNELMASDREFDRVVRDILNAYDQLISKKMKQDTFARVQRINEHRLQSVTNSLLDKTHDVREEYESEA
ncbi:MAG: hypothetical protein ACREBS_09575 [Nitrososphaerales archaeon]